jgi:hypothetical protein
MNINEVEIPLEYIGYCVLDINKKYFFDIVFYDKKNSKENGDRIYVLTENKIIKKIGGSAAKKGFYGTLVNGYRNASISGNASKRTIGIAYHIYQSLLKKNVIEIYGHKIPEIETQIVGLSNNLNTILTTANYKYYEDIFLSDYKLLNKTYPDWNYQEQHNSWEPIIIELERKYQHEKYKLNLKDLDLLIK